MAAPSPVLSSNSTSAAAATIATSITASASSTINSVRRMDAPPKTLRGLNKPKCRVCGNVARSRCPYESCKSCCSRNQNPCHIHVLKANATFPDKTPTSSSPIFDQQSTEPSPSGTSLRMASLRQLSNNFAQFNNVHIPLRSRKPLTRKDAAAINEWRFSKLKEYREITIEAENESFDRYMKNINLLEEIFSMKSILEESTEDKSSALNRNPSAEDNIERMISGMKLKLRANTRRSDNFRKRIQQIVDEGLKKLRKCELDDGNEKLDDQTDLDKGLRSAKGWRAERASALTDLIDNLNKARNEEDLKSCLAMKSQLFDQHVESSQLEYEDVDISKEQVTKNDSESRKESNYSLPKSFSTAEIDQETLNRIDAHFSSLEQIDDL